MEDVRRIFIGGLYEGISGDDLRSRFKSFGQVSDVDIRNKTDLDGNVVKTFAYVNLCGKEADFKKCISLLNKSKWKGSELQLQLAKESFLTKLKREQQSRSDECETEKRKKKPKQSSDKNVVTAILAPKVSKPDQRNWVRGKAGKLVPVLKVREPSSKKLIKNDPSKHQQTIKKLEINKYDNQNTKSIENLTWKITEENERNLSNISNIISSDSDDSLTYMPPGQAKKNMTILKNKSSQHTRKISQYNSSESDCETLETLTKHRVELQKTKTGAVCNLQRKSVNPAAKVEKSRSNHSVINISDTSDEVTFVSESSVLPKPTNQQIIPTQSEKVQWNIRKQNPVGNISDSESDVPDIVSWQKLNKSSSNMNIADNRRYSDSNYKSDDINVIGTKVGTLKSNKRKKYPGLELNAEEQKTSVCVHSSDDSEIVRKNTVNPKTEKAKTYDIAPKKVYNSDSDTNSSYYDYVGRKNEQKAKLGNIGLMQNCNLTDEFHAGFQESNLPYVSDSEEDDILDIIEARNWNKIERLHEQQHPVLQDSLIDKSKSLASSKPVSKETKKTKQTKHSPLIIKDNDSSSEIEEITEKMPKTDKKHKVQKSSDSESDAPDLESIPVYQNRIKSHANSDDNSLLSKSNNKQKISVQKGSHNMDKSKVKDKSIPTVYTSDSDTSEHYFVGKNVGKLNTQKVNVLPGWNLINEYDTGFKEYNVRDSSGSEDDILDVIAAGQWCKIKQLEKQHTGETSNKKGANDKKKLLKLMKTDRLDEEKVNCDNEKVEKSNFVSEETMKRKRISNQDLKETKNLVITSQMKHETSNLQRLETLKQKKKQADAQKTLIQKALATVDSGESSKKIVFDSDSDSLERTLPEKHLQKSSISKEEPKNKPTLFDSDDNDDDISSSESDTQRFNIKPQFEGKQGTKLMKLQTEFTNDQRFKLDSRFAQTDSENSDQEEDKIEKVAEEKNEKQKSLEVLQSVIGRKLEVDPRNKKRKTFKDINTLHYDPTKEDHQQFEIKTTPVHKNEEKQKKKKKTVVEEVDDDVPKVSDEKFFKVDSLFEDVFKDKKVEDVDNKEEEKPFSLLTMFGKAEDVEEPNKDSENISATWKPLSDTVKMPWGEDYDSSENEEHERKEETQTTIPSAPVSCDSDKFFITIDDTAVKECMEFFCRTEPLEELREKWQEKRPQLVEAYRLKRKRSIRKSRATQMLQAKYKKRKFMQKT